MSIWSLTSLCSALHSSLFWVSLQPVSRRVPADKVLQQTSWVGCLRRKRGREGQKERVRGGGRQGRRKVERERESWHYVSFFPLACFHCAIFVSRPPHETSPFAHNIQCTKHFLTQQVNMVVIESYNLGRHTNVHVHAHVTLSDTGKHWLCMIKSGEPELELARQMMDSCTVHVVGSYKCYLWTIFAYKFRTQGDFIKCFHYNIKTTCTP